MYSIIKQYKNLEKKKLKGIITEFESLEYKRFFILNFYPTTWESVYKKDNEMHFHYCPIYQETLSFENLLVEDLIKKPTKKNLLELQQSLKKNYSKKRLYQKWLINSKLILPLNNFLISFDKNVWKYFINKKVIEDFLYIYKKFFVLADDKKLKFFLKKKQKFLLNANIRKEIWVKNSLNLNYFKNFSLTWSKTFFKINLLFLYFINLTNKNFFIQNSFKEIPLQFFVQKTKKIKLKNIYLKNFFFNKITFLKFPKIIWSWTLLKNLKSLSKKKKFFNFVSKFKKIFFFSKMINFLFLKLSIFKIKFKLNKKWKIFFKINFKK